MSADFSPMQARSARVQDAVLLKKPDRVPFIPTVQNFYALGYDITIYEAMKNLKSIIPALEKFASQYSPDLFYLPSLFPIDVMERAGAKNLRWPGPYWGLPDNTPYQYIDQSFIEDDDDWERFMTDPTAFLIRKVLPGRYEAFEGLGVLDIHGLCAQAPLSLAGAALPPVMTALQNLLESAQLAYKAIGEMTEIAMHVVNMGYPTWSNFVPMSPFDEFADLIRGIMPTMMDMLTDPERLDEAVTRWGDVTIPSYITRAKIMHAKYAMIPLHCGVDEFMSVENYNKYYWPHLKRLLMALIGADITPIVLCEGKYYTRLETLTDVPKGKVVYVFEQTDMKRAKEIVGHVACIAGGFPTQYLISGSTERAVDETKRLIDICAPGGGYIMSNSLALDNIDHKLMEAWYETTVTYGKYL
jgi:hypothetical protein